VIGFERNDWSDWREIRTCGSVEAPQPGVPQPMTSNSSGQLLELRPPGPAVPEENTQEDQRRALTGAPVADPQSLGIYLLHHVSPPTLFEYWTESREQPSGAQGWRPRIKGHDVAELARRFATPLYVISRDQLRRNVRPSSGVLNAVGMSDHQAMPTADNKALVERFVEDVVNAGNTAAIADLCVPGSMFAAGIEGQMKNMKIAFPDNHFTIEEMVTEGDRVVIRLSIRGTNSGPLVGLPAFGRLEPPVPPTNRAVLGSGMQMFKIADGRIVSYSLELDQLGLLQQLGWTFTPPSPSGEGQ
jgi:predicted ester cyclase